MSQSLASRLVSKVRLATNCRPHSLLLGAFFALMSVAGGIASVVWGRYRVHPGSMAVRACLAASGMALALVDLGLWWTAAAMTLASAGATPTLAAIFTCTLRAVPANQSAVAFGWLATAQLAGMSLGAFTAGRLIGESGSWRYGVGTAVLMFSITATAGLVMLAVGRATAASPRARGA